MKEKIAQFHTLLATETFKNGKPPAFLNDPDTAKEETLLAHQNFIETWHKLRVTGRTFSTFLELQCCYYALTEDLKNTYRGWMKSKASNYYRAPFELLQKSDISLDSWIDAFHQIVPINSDFFFKEEALIFDHCNKFYPIFNFLYEKKDLRFQNTSNFTKIRQIAPLLLEQNAVELLKEQPFLNAFLRSEKKVLTPKEIKDIQALSAFYEKEMVRGALLKGEKTFETSLGQFYTEALDIRLSKAPLSTQAKAMEASANKNFKHRHKTLRLIADVLTTIFFGVGIIRLSLGHSFFWSNDLTKREKAFHRILNNTPSDALFHQQ